MLEILIPTFLHSLEFFRDLLCLLVLSGDYDEARTTLFAGAHGAVRGTPAGGFNGLSFV